MNTSNTSVFAHRSFLRQDELINNDQMRKIGPVEKIMEVVIFPFTWLAMVFNRRQPTIQQQLADQILKQEHARISSLRHAAVMRADAARSEVMRNELALIYEETVKAENKMKFMLDELAKGTSLVDIEKRIENNSYTHQHVSTSRVSGVNRFDPVAR